MNAGIQNTVATVMMVPPIAPYSIRPFVWTQKNVEIAKSAGARIRESPHNVRSALCASNFVFTGYVKQTFGHCGDRLERH